MYSTCAYDCFETLVPLSGQTSNSSNTLHTKHFNQLLSVCVVHHWAANRQCKAWLWSLSPWFHWARLCLTACATLFCSSFHATSYPTGSVSETERHSRLMLLLGFCLFCNFSIFVPPLWLRRLRGYSSYVRLDPLRTDRRYIRIGPSDRHKGKRRWLSME